MKVRIVLVEPHEEGNVGAAARAMRNFGVDDLVIVGNRERNPAKALWWACGGEEIVRSARSVATLDDALSDVQMTAATTAARERELVAPVTPEVLAQLAASRLAAGMTIAVVFGREDRGLTREELFRCQHAVTIPASADYPTMNLAQAVSIVCYEFFKCRPRAGASRESSPAPDALLQHLHENARRLLTDARFFENRDSLRLYGELQAIASRASLTQREASLLLEVIRRLQH